MPQGLRRIFEHSAEKFDFLLNEKSRSTSIYILRYSDGGSVRSMRRSKSIIDIYICIRRELLCKILIIIRFFLVESQIFEVLRNPKSACG